MARLAVLILCALLASPAFASRGLLQAPAPAPAAAISEADVLNFALNLEYLEATFYKCARDGTPLDANMTGGGPAPTGCMKAQGLDATQTFILDQLAKDEIEHVEFLRTALGSAAVPIPQIDIGSVWGAAGNAAAGGALNHTFSPYNSGPEFLLGAFTFEDVGVTAYNGGLGALTTPAYRTAAAGILGTEAYHAGAVRALLDTIQTAQSGYSAGGKDLTVGDVAGAISALRDGADCTPAPTNEDAGLTTLVPADKNGVTYSRSPAGVLKIVYLGNTNGGGFYPAGVNGAIKTAC